MKHRILMLAATVMLCGAWAVAQSAGGHAGGSMGSTGGHSTMGTQTPDAANPDPKHGPGDSRDDHAGSNHQP